MKGVTGICDGMEKGEYIVTQKTGVRNKVEVEVGESRPREGQLQACSCSLQLQHQYEPDNLTS